MLRLLADPRDTPLLTQAVRTLFLLPTGIAVALTDAAAWACIAHLALLVWNSERFITFFHDLSHRPLLRLRWLDPPLRALLGALHGLPPATYRAHHVLMHHPTENLADDVSTTLPYRRDSVRDFIRYYVRFFLCLAPLVRFLRARLPNRPRAAFAPVLGELGWWLVTMALAWHHLGVALTLLVVPLVWTRTLLIIGNWGEHAFVDPAAPDDPWRASVDLVGDRVNRRSFNVGYHIGHHLRPGAHFSTHPAYFSAHAEEWGAHDAVVLRDLHYPAVWWRLMRKDYRGLAERFVALPGAPTRTLEEVEALLRARVVPIGGGA